MLCNMHLWCHFLFIPVRMVRILLLMVHQRWTHKCPRSLNQAALFVHSYVSAKGISEMLYSWWRTIARSFKRALSLRRHIVFTLSDRRSIKSFPLQKEPESNKSVIAIECSAPVGWIFWFLLFLPERKEEALRMQKKSQIEQKDEHKKKEITQREDGKTIKSFWTASDASGQTQAKFLPQKFPLRWGRHCQILTLQNHSLDQFLNVSVYCKRPFGKEESMLKTWTLRFEMWWGHSVQSVCINSRYCIADCLVHRKKASQH